MDKKEEEKKTKSNRWKRKTFRTDLKIETGFCAHASLALFLLFCFFLCDSLHWPCECLLLGFSLCLCGGKNMHNYTCGAARYIKMLFISYILCAFKRARASERANANTRTPLLQTFSRQKYLWPLQLLNVANRWCCRRGGILLELRAKSASAVAHHARRIGWWTVGERANRMEQLFLKDFLMICVFSVSTRGYALSH